MTGPEQEAERDPKTGLKREAERGSESCFGKDYESWIYRGIGLLIFLLFFETWEILNGRWNSLNQLPLYIYFGVLAVYLLAERISYRGLGNGPDNTGKQTKKWTRYLLLLFWWPLLILPVLEYSLVPEYGFYPGYNFSIVTLGLALTLFGTGLRAWGLWSLGKYFSAHIEIRDNHELVETGPYRFIRHPAYAGNILQAAGIPLILNAYFSLSISAVLIFLFLYRLKLEEEVLSREVKGYEDYLKRTYRLIPKIW
ncbi:MAG: methyltransferase family protein [Methanosarcinaceae archaeon]